MAAAENFTNAELPNQALFVQRVAPVARRTPHDRTTPMPQPRGRNQRRQVTTQLTEHPNLPHQMQSLDGSRASPSRCEETIEHDKPTQLIAKKKVATIGPVDYMDDESGAERVKV